jgi:hypothetical protein
MEFAHFLRMSPGKGCVVVMMNLAWAKLFLAEAANNHTNMLNTGDQQQLQHLPKHGE